MEIEELNVYKMAMQLGEEIWGITSKWNYYEKDSMGKQLTRAADSIAANISEGYGRYHFKENINFCYYARGSLFETRTWLTKSYYRNLLVEKEYEHFLDEIKLLSIKLNNYIHSIGKITSHDV